jgi:hypothetical protein
MHCIALHYYHYMHIDSFNSLLLHISQQNSDKVSTSIHHIKFLDIYFWYSIQSN